MARALQRPKLPFDVGVPDGFFALDVSGKSGAHHHHRRYRKARAGKPAAGFLFAAMQSAKTVSNDRTCFVAFSAIYRRPEKEFDTSGKSGANQHHREIHKSSGGAIRRGLFCWGLSSRAARDEARMKTTPPGNTTKTICARLAQRRAAGDEPAVRRCCRSRCCAASVRKPARFGVDVQGQIDEVPVLF